MSGRPVDAATHCAFHSLAKKFSQANKGRTVERAERGNAETN